MLSYIGIEDKELNYELNTKHKHKWFPQLKTNQKQLLSFYLGLMNAQTLKDREPTSKWS